MPVISFVNQKGGVGKTTLSLSVAAALADQCSLTIPAGKVLLIDADPQGTASTWASLRTHPAGFAVVAMPRPNMHQDVARLAEDHDYVVIDGPPGADATTRSCIIASDIVVVPIEPGGFSRWSAALIVRQLEEAMTVKPIRACFVLSRKIAGTVLGREARAMIASAGLPLLRTEVEQRIVYAEAGTMAKTVFEWSSSSKAVFEIQNLVDDILGLPNGQDIAFRAAVA